jgi:sugar O-acyltransferase (sialic acid O-acetyltransferase NeuD family)
VSYSNCSIIGYSGHGLVVTEAAKLSGLPLGFYSDLESKEVNPYHLSYIGDESKDSFDHWDKGYGYILGIGNNRIRLICANKVIQMGCEVVNIIHPAASISAEVEYGTGNFFSRNVSVNPMVRIGNYGIINTGCVIEHDCILGDAVHVGPGAVLLGAVQVGNGSFIGANSVVKQGVKIGDNVVVGAGSVVLKDIPNGKTVVGNPAKEI